MKKLRFGILAAFLTVLPSLSVQAETYNQSDFETWISETIWPMASDEGISRSTFDQALGRVKLNPDLPGMRVPTKESAPVRQRQAEFSSPSKYFKPSILNANTANGKSISQELAGTLAAVERDTGVPWRIIMAIWGRESAYGKAPIDRNAFEVLASKGFLDARAKYFTRELIAALKIVEEGHIPASDMKSSWAGAMGQPQFMPSNFLKYAADGNGDRKADIWSSRADTIASIGSFLAKHGWQPGRDWGFEVNLPKSVSCTLEGPDQGRKIQEWADLGVTRVSGKPFPRHELAGEGFLLMPAGHFGPAFIVTPNFYVLKDYNRSDLYALFVGHVGDRIQYQMGDFKYPWKPIDSLYRSDVAEIQRALEAEGHDVGGADGLPGYKTRRSIGRWQRDKGLNETCFPSKALLNQTKNL